MFPKCFTLSTSQMWKMLSKRRRVVTRVHTHFPLPWLGLWQLWWGRSLLSVSYLAPLLTPTFDCDQLVRKLTVLSTHCEKPLFRLVLLLGPGFTESVDMAHDQWNEIEFLLCWHCWPKSIYISATDQILRRIPFIFLSPSGSWRKICYLPVTKGIARLITLAHCDIVEFWNSSDGSLVFWIKEK